MKIFFILSFALIGFVAITLADSPAPDAQPADADLGMFYLNIGKILSIIYYNLGTIHIVRTLKKTNFRPPLPPPYAEMYGEKFRNI